MASAEEDVRAWCRGDASERQPPPSGAWMGAWQKEALPFWQQTSGANVIKLLSVLHLSLHTTKGHGQCPIQQNLSRGTYSRRRSSTYLWHSILPTRRIGRCRAQSPLGVMTASHTHSESERGDMGGGRGA
ncbi:hypothetical protein AAFF_G00226380 [Aldrovandia affinis]|uniref:Uncharacterized protein n=1 Tax=Aldrovandia affinis TaxID=143900 RepID=A0AAD7X2E4_9TELE|nr:hypothetical protein AAFF_G00226380 [Aldrovandia affinis]